ncbi:hypothetical protein HMPREF2863_07640 [Micrococcus sp. HMSC067E09]|uniref:DUF3040 domain-containing protein n=1 Tax=Micrococcus TaxID=1269 RepID=UPI0008A5F28E|nr:MULTISPECIES: DUF3040 domain-containing protein [Micrococcus]OFR90152.1 hypothetical protein HMPREF2863_07640 [Micrococcus sp. HMSC067E09]WIK83091.1 DUF3040 domain-containing protein [Micrococcus lylae]
MPLSEREQRMLDELEAQLRTEDPRLDTHLRDSRPGGVSVRRVVLGVAIAVAGLAVVLLGVSLQNVIVGVVGVAVMGAGVYVLTSRGSGDSSEAGRADAGARAAAGGKKKESDFMSRLEQQWDERRGQGR